MLWDSLAFVYPFGVSLVATMRGLRLQRIANRPAVLTPGELLMHRLHERVRGGMTIVGVARMAGRLAPAAVDRVCCQLQRRHPALRASICNLGRRAEFRVSDTPPAIPSTFATSDDSHAWCMAALELGRVPFDVGRGPLLRMHVIQHPIEDCCDVMIAIHHAIADGRSLTVLFGDFARLAAGQSLPESDDALRPLPHVPRPHGVWGPVFREVGYQVALRRRLRRHPWARPPVQSGAEDVVRRRLWTRAGTAALRKRCQEEGTTVFGALTAACLQVLWRNQHLAGQSIKLRTPLDLRSRCDPPISQTAVGCYATMLDLTMIAVGGQKFWDLARQARREVDRQLTAGLWAASWHLLRWLLHRGAHLPVRPTLCGISNLGVVETPAGPALPICELSSTVNQRGLSNNVRLSCATVDGTLNLTLRSPWHSVAQVEELLDDFIEQLESATDFVSSTPAGNCTNSRPHHRLPVAQV